ncbi:MAG: hypothetical protein LBR95_02205 [Azoarcus sp.]|jgi:hypothetical protein|nr:hypothetical protein [Azoarcus sp.]
MIDPVIVRQDYRTVRDWWRNVEAWNESDLAEADVLLSTAMRGNDETLKAHWAGYLARRADMIGHERAMNAERCRRMEARIKATAAERAASAEKAA